MSLERFCELSLPFVERAGIAYPSRDALLRALAIVKPKVKHLSDVPDWISFLFTEDYPFEESSLEKAIRKPGALERLQTLGEALKNLPEWTHASIEAKLKETAAALGVKAGELVHPARVAVTGKSIGPGLYETLEILGRERVLARFKRAAELATQKFAPTGSAQS